MDIYEKHSKAFANVSAYVVLRNGQHIARVAFKHAKSGMQLDAYVHLFGIPMERGYARGGGYDKHTAAVSSAAQRIKASKPDMRYVQDVAAFDAFIAAALLDDGSRWDTQLRTRGFAVIQAV